MVGGRLSILSAFIDILRVFISQSSGTNLSQTIITSRNKFISELDVWVIKLVKFLQNYMLSAHVLYQNNCVVNISISKHKTQHQIIVIIVISSLIMHLNF